MESAKPLEGMVAGIKLYLANRYQKGVCLYQKGAIMNPSAFSVRMDTQLKNDFSLICEDFGMSVSTAFTLFAKAVVREHRIPFEIKSDLPNTLTMRTIEPAEIGKELHGSFSSIHDLRESLNA